MNLRRISMSFCAAFAFCVMAASLSGCASLGEQRLDYHLVSVRTERDAKTGDWVRIALWRYADGTYTSTTEIFTPGTTKADRQEAQLDPPRARYAG